MKVEIEVVGKGKAVAVLDDRNPETAKGIYESLPVKADATKWLEEVYFGMELKMDYENPSPRTEAGDLSYWPPGPAFCVFYGESQPVSDVNNFGKVTENLELFKQVQDGDKLIIQKL
jgi:uncharacterized protein